MNRYRHDFPKTVPLTSLCPHGRHGYEPCGRCGLRHPLRWFREWLSDDFDKLPADDLSPGIAVFIGLSAIIGIAGVIYFLFFDPRA